MSTEQKCTLEVRFVTSHHLPASVWVRSRRSSTYSQRGGESLISLSPAHASSQGFVVPSSNAASFLLPCVLIIYTGLLQCAWRHPCSESELPHCILFAPLWDWQWIISSAGKQRLCWWRARWPTIKQRLTAMRFFSRNSQTRSADDGLHTKSLAQLRMKGTKNRPRQIQWIDMYQCSHVPIAELTICIAHTWPTTSSPPLSLSPPLRSSSRPVSLSSIYFGLLILPSAGVHQGQIRRRQRSQGSLT